MYALLSPSFSANAAPAAPCRASVVQTRKKAFCAGLARRSLAASGPIVNPSLTVDGLICASPASLVIGISAAATLELYGPRTASTLGSETNVRTLATPCCGLCTPCTASSSCTASSVNPPGSREILAWSIASSMPLSVLRPTEASAPESGKSMPSLIVFPEVPLPPEQAAKHRHTASVAIEAVIRRANISGGLASSRRFPTGRAGCGHEAVSSRCAAALK